MEGLGCKRVEVGASNGVTFRHFAAQVLFPGLTS